MNGTYNPTLTIIDFLAVERLACIYPVPCTPEVNKRTALGLAVCVVYDIAVRYWPDLACQKVVDVGGGYILLRTESAARQKGPRIDLRILKYSLDLMISYLRKPLYVNFASWFRDIRVMGSAVRNVVINLR